MIKQYKQLFFQYLEDSKHYNEKVTNFNITLEKSIKELEDVIKNNFLASTYETPAILARDKELQALSLSIYEDQTKIKKLCAKFSKEDATQLKHYFPLAVKKEPGDYINAINKEAFKRYQAEDYEANIGDTPNEGLIYKDAVEEALVQAIHTIFGSSYEGSSQKIVTVEAELVK